MAERTPAAVAPRSRYAQKSTSPQSQASSHMAHATPTKTPEVELEKAAANYAVRESLPTVVLCSASVVLRHTEKKIHTNALLDDGSTSSSSSSSVAAELGLDGGVPNNLPVQLLNGKSCEFTSTPVTLCTQSMDSTVDEYISVQTLDKIAANLTVVQWQEYAATWRNLRRIVFPPMTKQRPVDLLIGVDLPSFHCGCAELSRRDEEPVARLTKLGKTCIGKLPLGCTTMQCYHNSFLMNRIHSQAALPHLLPFEQDPQLSSATTSPSF